MSGKTEVKVVLDDITRMKVNAVVNAANRSLLGGGGVDGAIHRKAGQELLAECQMLPLNETGHRCNTGEARITGAYGLPAKRVIHTVGPVYPRDGGDDEAACWLLRSCYEQSLRLAQDNNLRSIAFPAISTGIYGFPRDRAAEIAYETVMDYIAAQPKAFDLIYFVVFDDETENIYLRLMNG